MKKRYSRKNHNCQIDHNSHIGHIGLIGQTGHLGKLPMIYLTNLTI